MQQNQYKQQQQQQQQQNQQQQFQHYNSGYFKQYQQIKQQQEPRSSFLKQSYNNLPMSAKYKRWINEEEDSSVKENIQPFSFENYHHQQQQQQKYKRSNTQKNILTNKMNIFEQNEYENKTNRPIARNSFQFRDSSEKNLSFSFEKKNIVLESNNRPASSNKRIPQEEKFSSIFYNYESPSSYIFAENNRKIQNASQKVINF